jgi:hypothetical protein
VWENVLKGTKNHSFAHTKEPHAHEAGIAACSPTCKYVNLKRGKRGRGRALDDIGRPQRRRGLLLVAYLHEGRSHFCN